MVISKLQESIAAQLTNAGIPFQHLWDRANATPVTIEYNKPARPAKYSPTFTVTCDDGSMVILQQKGRFVTADRQKHNLIKDQYGTALDVRFVFSSSRQTISATSQTTYAIWCVRFGFQFCDKVVPEAWIVELQGRTERQRAVKAGA